MPNHADPKLEVMKSLAAKLGEGYTGFEGAGVDPATGEGYNYFGIRCVRGNRVVMCRLDDRADLFDDTLVDLLRAEMEWSFARADQP